MNYRVPTTLAAFYVCWWVAGGIAAVHYLPSVLA